SNNLRQDQVFRLCDRGELKQIRHASLLMLACRAGALRRRVLMREKSKTQSARHSESAIVCCAATKANNDFVRATIRGVQNHFASAECICPKRITFALS